MVELSISTAPFSPAAGGTNVFIWKGDENGNTIWAKSAASVSSDYGYSIATDASGSCFVTGKYGLLESEELSMTLDTITINSVGGDDIFIAKYSAASDIQWAFSAGSTWRYDQGNAIAADANGNCIATGLFWGGLGTYDGFFGSFVLEGTGNYDAFICKIGDVFTATPGEFHTAAPVIVFPNPLPPQQYLEIYFDISNEIPDAPFLFTLYDPFGRKVMEALIHSHQSRFENNSLPPGIYFYSVISEGYALGSGKLIVE